MRGEVPDNGGPMRFGEAAIRREGNDVTIVGHLAHGGHRRARRREARLGRGHRGRGDRPAHAAPLDLDTILESVRKTNRCVVVEEGWPHGGVGANLAALVQEQAFDYLDAPDAARHRRGRADALFEGSGAGRDAPRGARREGGAGDVQRRLMAEPAPMAVE